MKKAVNNTTTTTAKCKEESLRINMYASTVAVNYRQSNNQEREPLCHQIAFH